MAKQPDVEELLWSQSLLHELTQCQLKFLTTDHPKDAFERLLAALLRLTDSEYGFIGEVLTRDDAPYLRTHAITDISWDDATREFYMTNAPRGLEFFNLNTLFGSVLVTGEMILSNDPKNDPRAGGVPPGHPALNAFLGIPCRIGDEFVGMAGIANRPGGYDEALYCRLEPFRITTAALIRELRARKERKAAADALSTSQKKLSAIFDGMLDGVIVIDFRGNMVESNPAACKLFQYERDEMIGRNVSMLMPTSQAGLHDEYMHDYYRTGIRKTIGSPREVRGMRADGSIFPCTIGVNEIRDAGTRYFVGTVKDITKRREQEEVLRQAKAELEEERWRLASIIGGTNVGTWEWNVQTGETQFNERWCEIIGYTLAELEPVSIETWIQYANPDDLQASNAALEKHFNGQSEYYELECRMKHRDGHWVWVLDRGKVFSWSDDGKPLMMFGTHQDITHQKDYEKEIEHLATHDPLTNLLTARSANDRIYMAVERAKREKNLAAVFFVDLDGFKAVNDVHGHHAGDTLLRIVADRFQKAVRGVDTVARIGGDEFLLVCGSMNRADTAKSIAKNLLAQVADPIDVEGNEVRVGLSIGIAMIPTDGTEPATLIRAADTAMYRVKQAGKNAFAFYDEDN